MREWIAQRVAAGIIGLVAGIFLAIMLLEGVADLNFAWLLIVVPIASGIVAMVLGDAALRLFKEMCRWRV